MATTTVEALLAELHERGIQIRVAGPGDLRLSPREAVDPGLYERLKAAKPDLLVHLTGCYPCERCGRFAFSQPAVCYWCATTREARA
ncbi:MAG TPA: hypothetical protein VMM35_07895 [Longimicrobiales bacterium]|nr:hypothetical protein [Longimicrobiales bacterium]